MVRLSRRLWVRIVLGVGISACADREGGSLDASDPGRPEIDAGSGGEDGGGGGAKDAGGREQDAGLFPCDAGQEKGCVATEPEPACGDGLINVAGEECDDGNDVTDDGCTATCMRDPDYDCPAPGQACVYTVECGDAKRSGAETCDDANAVAGDGCSATCQVEPGYECPVTGLRCQATACGDGIVAGFEECDFMATVPGCTSCRIDTGYDCDTTGCSATDCGNGTTERGEQCDDGQDDAPFDGCYGCKAEPQCSNGICTSVCGDGQRFADEACDDGNLRAGDGCAADCTIEPGFACQDLAGDPPESLSLPILLRDFIGKGRSLKTGCDDPIAVPTTTKPCYHIDFNGLGGSVRPGVVAEELDAQGRPVYVCPDPQTGCAMNPGHVANPKPESGRYTFNGPAAFRQWYDSSSPNAYEVVSSVSLTRNATTGVYVYDAAPQGGFYPLNGKGWVAEGSESATFACGQKAPEVPGTNVSFTSETHFWFEYQGGERFEFVGDDDLWVFVDGKLLLDLGGLHGSMTARFTLGPIDDGGDGSIDVNPGVARVQNQALHNLSDPSAFSLNDLGLTVGGVYEVTMFHAERNECGSNFKVTLKDFNRPKSQCASECGDGKLASDELCDQGAQNADPPPYGGCSKDCKQRGPSCGDGLTDADAGEACDDGVNITVYGQQAGDCAPGCKRPAFCGDGVVQSGFGEKCDDKKNDGSYGKCAPGCVLGPRCGDGVVQEAAGEDCDDGNLESYDGCNVNCRAEIII